MAKRLSKALRGKRRWFGLAIDAKHTSRKDVEKILTRISSEFEISKKLRLMDFVHSGSDKKSEETQLELIPNSISSPFGLVIVEVPLKSSQEFKELLSQQTNISNYGLESLTMSGKIRLVRERLNLEKPKRKR
ncbi:MAG: hypothetical protein DWB99_01060 [Candidatus Poseidoniales archaeon]|nr:MAG: hypothetical protein DWB99_01060 [Candidatus Poseidoniales archaeon]|tara:strand:+ start:2399 stop:2797 length:399 start_codon:yes stop_codon:yes gene_type:complete